MWQALKSCDVQIITGFNVRNKCMCNMGIFMGVLFFSSWSYFILWTYFLRVSHMKFVLVRDVNNRTHLNEANQILQPLHSTTAKKPYQLCTFTICVLPQKGVQWNRINSSPISCLYAHINFLPTHINLWSTFFPDLGPKGTSLFPKFR